MFSISLVIKTWHPSRELERVVIKAGHQGRRKQRGREGRRKRGVWVAEIGMLNIRVCQAKSQV